MGGSAASAVAALIAANALLDRPLSRRALYPFALDGEAVASGSRHGDNVGAMLLGGLVLSTADRLVPIPIPAGLHCALVHPHAVLETRAARAALEGGYDLSTFVAQSANLAQLLAGCYAGDFDLIRSGLDDVLIEPRRMALVPGFPPSSARRSTRRARREHLRRRAKRLRLVRRAKPSRRRPRASCAKRSRRTGSTATRGSRPSPGRRPR